MSAEGVTALLNGDRPAGWLQYHDGSWAPVGYDGKVGTAITADDLLAVAREDLAALEEAGLITEVIDVEPLEVIDFEHQNPGGRARSIQLALDHGATGRAQWRDRGGRPGLPGLSASAE
ncbi:hypothetical protein [Nocardia seriolae]|uniref:Uncharacterized protein n=2 Tax=Nocardia seriolae TaxID=37332 RepID=A0ABC9Z423_9NOCA|nr:hypothetical protein [Nocardia seriolae]GEM28129.1 hypothetical protein NS2_63680 [Nocardia seriolae NBRC 15557]APA96803.1 hypothetical protein NS506_02743 [Nocardia seriolae]OJF82057.1 hypothetical protein NS14008_26425 [Nocardia seriolae]PSK27712.1 hypothetical protein C6575_30375 [Nocardia seriolae]QUN14980.1 hypothetical protein KEC46_21375 [Nocardia seriolae]